MIVVLGRPSVHRPEPDGELAPAGLATEIARALAQEGAAVELAGSLGDDPEGDSVIVALSRAGVGHAALLRDASARTPSLGVPAGEPLGALVRAVPRLDGADVELALGYLAECRVLVVAARLEGDALAAALRAADYHGSAVVIVAEAGAIDPETLGDRVTLLEHPPAGDEGDDEAADPAFAAFVAAYALRLDRGEAPARAFAAALGDSAWEPAAE